MSKQFIDPTVPRSVKSEGYAPVVVAIHRPRQGAQAEETGAPSRETLKDQFLNELPLSQKEKRALERMAVKHGPGPDKDVKAAAISRESRLRDSASMPRYFPRLGIYWGYLDKIGLDNLSASNQVKAIYQPTQLSLIVPKQIENIQTPEAPLWNLRDFESLWQSKLRGNGIKIGHLDTGVDGAHEAFAGKAIRFIEVDEDGDRVESSENKPRDSGRHGTHTAATLCGDTVEGVKIGIAPEAELVSAMVIEGGKTELRTLVGLEWMLEQGVQVVNLSLGWVGYNPFFEAVMKSLRDNGVLPVVAVGNEGPRSSRSPGNYESAFSVGAVDWAGRVPNFSSSQVRGVTVKPDVVAPGVGIVSARASGGLISMDGTSMAAPHVSGLAALLLGVPGATPELVQDAIEKTAGGLPFVSPLRQGHGTISPEAALEALMAFINSQDPPDPPDNSGKKGKRSPKKPRTEPKKKRGR